MPLRNHTITSAEYPHHFILELKHWNQGWIKPAPFRLKHKFAEALQNGAEKFLLVLVNEKSRQQLPAEVNLAELRDGDYRLMIKDAEELITKKQ